MSRITCLADIEGLRAAGKISDAEEKLITNCKAGVPTVLREERPEAPAPDCAVQAELLRFLILGGCEDCCVDVFGVDLNGAYITGALDLSFGTARGRTVLAKCMFANSVEALLTRFEMLALDGTGLPGLMAQDAQVTGSVFLRDGFHATGEVSLSGAAIGGQLTCYCSKFENPNGTALDASGAEVKGDMLLGRKTHYKGSVVLMDVSVGRQLNCAGGTFERRGGVAFTLQDAIVGSLFWRDVVAVSGAVDLNGACLGSLTDDFESWKKSRELILNGLKIVAFHGFTDVTQRLEWLHKGAHVGGEFRPQPYEEFARVLREMGHAGDARRIQLAKENLLAQDRLRRNKAKLKELRTQRDVKPTPPNHSELQKRISALWWEGAIMPIWYWMLRYLIGYGYAPQRALWWAISVIGAGGLFYLWVWHFGGIVPNSDVILVSDAWKGILETGTSTPGADWEDSATGQHYETFASLVYAADVFIPLIDFGQQSAWAPTTATRLGTLAWAGNWGLEFFGWIVTALGAAAITGIIRRE